MGISVGQRKCLTAIETVGAHGEGDEGRQDRSAEWRVGQQQNKGEGEQVVHSAKERRRRA